MTLLLLTCCLAAADPEPAPPPRELTPVIELERMAEEYAEIKRDFYAKLRKAGRDSKAVDDENQKYRDAGQEWGERALALVRRYPTEPAAFDAIESLLYVMGDKPELLSMLRVHHFSNPKMLGIVNSVAQSSDAKVRGLAEDIADKHPDRDVRGKATLTLGRLDRIYLVDSTEKQPSFGGRLGPPDKLRARSEAYLRTVIEKYPDVRSESETLRELAEAELAGLKNVGKLEVGLVPPEVVGADVDGKPLKLTPADGKVKVLIFWGTWCGPCMALVPTERKLVEDHSGKPFALFGVNGGDERETAKEAMAAKQMTWPSFFGGMRGGIPAEWNVQAWPTVFVIDPAGVIRYKGHGEGLEEAVAQCFADLRANGKPSDR